MNVAVAQSELHLGEWSWNLRSVTASVARAAEHHPAPDLIALPDCRGLGLAAQDANVLTLAMCQGFVEALASAAREWGVWIAAGHARACDGRVLSEATVFDPDGDPYLRHRSPQFADGSSKMQDAPAAWSVRRTPLGVVALRCGPSPNGGSSIAAPQDTRIDLAVVPNALDEAPCTVARAVQLARSTTCYVCLVNGAVRSSARGGDAPEGSVVVDRQGKIIAQTEPGVAQTAVVTMDITPPAMPLLDNSEDDSSFE